MTSFSDTFPDTAILAVLGDDIEHINGGGGSTMLKGEFEFKYLEEEIGDMIDIVYPVAEVNTLDAKPVDKHSRIKVSGVTYKLLKKRPVNVGKVQLVLRSI